LIYITKGAQLSSEKQKKHERDLIEWGISIKTAEMDHFPKPFIIGLLRKCRREVLPALSDVDLKRIENDSYIAMLSRKYKGEDKIPEQKRKPKYFYE